MHPLSILSTAPTPDDVTDPTSREALVRCARSLQRLLPPGCWPRPYQHVAIAYGEISGDNFLDADDMGLGKTIVALCRILLGGYKVACVVTTSATLHKWEETARKWLPKHPVLVLDGEGRPAPLPGWQGIIFTTWDLLKYTYLVPIQRMRPEIVVFDEAHYAKNPESDRYRAMADLCAGAPHRILLTGTPITNTAEELYTLLHVVAPSAWPEVTQRAFATVAKDVIDVPADSRLTARIRQYMVRRRKSQVPSDIPDKSRQEIRVQLTPSQRAEYVRLDTAFKRWLETHLTAIARREAAKLRRDVTGRDLDEIHAKVEAATKREFFAKVGYLRRFLGPAKVPAALDWIARMRQAREPVVVFFEHQTVHRALMAGLDARGLVYESIVGETSRSQRAQVNARFQRGQVPILLASQAAKEGVDFTAARHELILEPWWTGAAEDQAEDRLHRDGQRNRVTIWRMIAQDTYDENIQALVTLKRSVTARFVGA